MTNISNNKLKTNNILFENNDTLFKKYSMKSKTYNFKSKLINKIFQIKKAPLLGAFCYE